MNDDDDQLLYLGLGPLLAILLGGGLIPLRDLTVPSNFTFAFLALTIVVGELGGRLPALGTALVSALSLDFFLTRPYLHLAMHDKNDLVAFVGLAACGLLAAFLGTPRRERDSARRRLAVVDRALRQIEAGGPAAARIQLLADIAVAALPLAAAVVRDDAGRVVAAAGPRSAIDREPASVVGTPAVAEPEHGDWRQPKPPLPAEGQRIALVVAGRPAGALDVWGDGGRAGRDARRALAAMATAVGAILDADRPPPPGPRADSAWSVGPRRAGS
jgi:hypothetical protein